ncbi:MAG: bifunctional oligoribonuclease/PAP phosphatase NrnA [Bacilli bacterium]|nr:bifunctional oligoribonuclease/PAP phosphatase NrnA [Bacilli bacterium]
MINPVIKKIYKKIKKYNTIVIARHIGPDPDAVCSQIALRDTIKATFPSKNVYAVGMSVSRFKSFGTLDKINEEELDNPLLIVLDVPNISRIDGITFSRYKEVIKIDHHPYEDKMGDTELVDTTSCSVAQLIGELVLNTRLKLTKEVAENIFLGIVSDSDRFLLQYTTAKTFKIVNQIIEKTNLDFTNLYVRLYERPLNEIRFQGYLAQNLIITENGFAYIKITTDDIKNFGVDSSTASNMINNFNYIKEIKVWTFITYDQKSTMYKVNIRSRNVIINDIAAKYHGGGHKFASGVRTTSEVDIDNLIKDLDERCLEVNHE